MNLNLTSTELVTVEEVAFIQELDAYRFPNRVFQRYRHNTKGCLEITYEEAKKKLIRNIILSEEAPFKEGLQHKRVFYYGCLSIHINLNERSICYINNTACTFHANINEQKKRMLNEMMSC